MPFGSTQAGVLYLPLLGPQRAGPMCLSGPAAADLLASVVIFALGGIEQNPRGEEGLVRLVNVYG